MSIFRVLDKIENAIFNSTPLWPFKDRIIVNREKFLALIEKTRKTLPEEMKRARLVTKDNQRILQEARDRSEEILRESQEKARRMLEAAKEEAARLLDQSEIMTQARKKAEDIIRQAQEEAQEHLRLAHEKAASKTAETEAQVQELVQGANEYAEKILSGLENELTRILPIIQKGRKQLQEAIKKNSDDRP
jgi:cell division septum initiation protein DivIVA